MTARAYEVSTAFDNYMTARTEYGPTVAKVRYRVWLNVRDVWSDIEFEHIRVRFHREEAVFPCGMDT